MVRDHITLSSPWCLPTVRCTTCRTKLLEILNLEPERLKLVFALLEEALKGLVLNNCEL